MKRLVSLLLSAALVLSMACTALAAPSGSVTDNGSSCTVRCDGAQPGEAYALLVVKCAADGSYDPTNAANILYIAQSTADAAGKLEFSNVIPTTKEKAVFLLSGGPDAAAPILLNAAAPQPVTPPTPQPTSPSAAYSDLAPNAWYERAVNFVLEKGIMNGVGSGKFGPSQTVTRATVVQMLWALEGKPVVNYLMQFGDVPAEAWYTEATRWAAAEGIVTGYSPTSFAPNAPVTREQMAVILHGYARYKGMNTAASTSISAYADAAAVSTWAVPGLQWACGAGILSGKAGGYLDPSGITSRVEAAQMLMKFCS